MSDDFPHNLAPNKTTLSDLKAAEKQILTYKIHPSNKAADHARAARDAALILIAKLEPAFAAELETSLAQAQYVKGLRAFILTVPIPIADAATRLLPRFAFQAEANGCDYILELQKDASIAAKSRSISDSAHYFWINLPPGYVATDQVTFEEVAKYIQKAGLLAKDYHHQTDLETGSLLPRFRIGFELTDQFNPYMLARIREIPAPGAFSLLLRFSPEFCNTYKIHRDCLRFFRMSAPKEARDQDICPCLNSTPSVRRDPFSRKAAQNAYMERLKKRRLAVDTDQ